jgi:hypothetical protein
VVMTVRAGFLGGHTHGVTTPCWLG